MQHANNVQKSMMMYGTEATGGLGSSSNLLVSFIKFSLHVCVYHTNDNA